MSELAFKFAKFISALFLSRKFLIVVLFTVSVYLGKITGADISYYTYILLFYIGAVSLEAKKKEMGFDFVKKMTLGKFLVMKLKHIFLGTPFMGIIFGYAAFMTSYADVYNFFVLSTGYITLDSLIGVQGNSGLLPQLDMFKKLFGVNNGSMGIVSGDGTSASGDTSNPEGDGFVNPEATISANPESQVDNPPFAKN
jgi:hypothetical protein